MWFETDRRLIRVQSEALYSTTIFGPVMSVVAAIVMTVSAWSAAVQTFLLWWTFAMIAQLVLRVVAVGAFRRHAGEDSLGWCWLIVGMATLIGLTWGVGIFYMIWMGTDHQLMVIVCLGLGAVMMGIPTIAFWPAHAGFQGSLLSLAALGFATSGRPGHSALAVAAVLLLVAMTLASRKLSQKVVEAMRVSAENQRLVDALRERGEELETLNRQLEELTRVDPLTGLANRRWLYEVLDREFARSARSGTPLSLLAIDVDYFKRYNDRHGHAAGDACLIAVGNALNAAVRAKVDLAARPGGEEFALLLVGADRDLAGAIALRVRQMVIAATADPDAGLPAPVSVSIGVATISPAEGELMSRLLDGADAALYRAKHRGRNRVEQSFEAA